MRRLAFILCLSLPALAQTPAHITKPDDFAWRWPMATTTQSSAYLLRLTPEIYASLHGAGLGDLAVFNAAGQRLPLGPLPAWVMPTEQLNEQHAQWTVKHFPPLPTPEVASHPKDAPVKIEVENAAGTRIKVETGDAKITHPPELPPLSLEQLAERGPPLRLNENGRAHLLYPDVVASISSDNGVDNPVEELQVSWETDIAPRGYWRLSALDDDGRRIAAMQSSVLGGSSALEGSDRLIAPGVVAHEFVLEAFQVDASFKIRSITPYTRSRTQFAYQEWMEAHASSAPNNMPGEFLYSLPGPLLINRAQIVLNAPGTLAQVALYQRNRAEESWQLATGGEIYQLQLGNVWVESGMLAINPVRVRELRLVSQPALLAQPQLKLAYRPDYLVFLAQGAAPYTLYAGSAAAVAHDDGPLIEQLLRKARAELGSAWLPPAVSLSARETAAGADALVAITHRDWKTWLLWALLVAAAGVVVAMALSLLRGIDGNRS